jgi:2-keto-3-deoxy-L-rhamnonate aldolase RhmA
MLGYMGFDCVLIDNEHGSITAVILHTLRTLSNDRGLVEAQPKCLRGVQ